MKTTLQVVILTFLRIKTLYKLFEALHETHPRIRFFLAFLLAREFMDLHCTYCHVQHNIVPQRGGGGGVEHDRLEEVGQVALVEEDQVGADHARGA